MRGPNDYLIFLPTGEVVESDKGVESQYRIKGTIIMGWLSGNPNWFRWRLENTEPDSRISAGWQQLTLEEVPVGLRTKALLLR